jgi:hypothetical protein
MANPIIRLKMNCVIVLHQRTFICIQSLRTIALNWFLFSF